jgi:hypothetical protein
MDVRFFSSTLLSVLMGLLSGYQSDLSASQAQFGSVPAQLEEALRAGNLEAVRELILDDQDGAEELFLKYLEETSAPGRPKPGEIHPLEKARRLADVFFRIYELDFERGIVSYWEKATVAQKQALLPILRDHFAAYQEARKISRQMPQPIEE